MQLFSAEAIMHTLDELCSGGAFCQKVKEFPPQPRLELVTSWFEV
mgnify:CR=1 FL=1